MAMGPMLAYFTGGDSCIPAGGSVCSHDTAAPEWGQLQSHWGDFPLAIRRVGTGNSLALQDTPNLQPELGARGTPSAL